MTKTSGYLITAFTGTGNRGSFGTIGKDHGITGVDPAISMDIPVSVRKRHACNKLIGFQFYFQAPDFHSKHFYDTLGLIAPGIDPAIAVCDADSQFLKERNRVFY